MLRYKEAQKYLENAGDTCPFCGDDDIGGSQIEVEMGVAWQKVSCQRCGEEWIDYYSMDRVAVEDEQDDLVVFELERSEQC